MLPSSGSISISQLNTEVGAASTSQRALSWLQSNSALGYKDLGSIRGLYFFSAVSSVNSVSRTTSATTTNCTTNCVSQTNPNGFAGGAGNGGGGYYTNCNLRTSVNCNQCGYAHGGSLIQANCNCNCNCYNCNCAYNNCDCNCNCQCQCGDGD